MNATRTRSDGDERDRIGVRRATAADLGAIAPLMESFNVAEEIPWRPEAMLAALERLMGDGRLGWVVIANDAATSKTLGYGIATFGYDIEWAGRDAFVTELFVDPSARGEGLGRRLLEALVSEVRAQGARAVHLVVRHENAGARALYESCGFRQVPRLLMTRPLDSE